MKKMKIKKIKSNKFRKLTVAVSAVAMLASCGTTDVNEENIASFEKKEAETLGQKYVTAYDNSLRDFGKMLQGYNVPDTRIMNKPIGNRTGSKSLPGDLSRMLATAMGKIGKKILYIEYDPIFLRGETNAGTNIQRTLPDVLIVGDITEYDKGLISKDSGGESEGEYQQFSAVAEITAESKVSRLAMDMNMTDYKTLVSLGCQISNSMKIMKTKSGFNFGFFYLANGMNINSNFSQNQGKEAALRRLIELSILQTLGKYFQVPYWKCIKGAPADQDMIEKIKEQFIVQPTSIQIAYIKEYLFLNMYENINRQTPMMNDYEMAAFEDARKRFGTQTDEALFLALWENVPVEKSRLRFLRLENEDNNSLEMNQEITRQQELYNQQLEAQKNNPQTGVRETTPVEETASVEQKTAIAESTKVEVTQPVAKSAKVEPPAKNVESKPKKKKSKIMGFGKISEDEW